MKTCAIIPLKELKKSKSRLSNFLKDKERIELTLNMLRDVVEAFFNSGKVNQIFIISQDQSLDLDNEIINKFEVIFDPSTLNDSLERQIKNLKEYAAKIIVPCDIPLISKDDVDAVYKMLERYDVIISPSCDSGTNLLAIKGDLRFKLEFGEGKKSFLLHLKNAVYANLKVYVYSNERIALDLDDETRLKYLATLDIDKHSIRYLRGVLIEGNKNNSD